ncbi:MAG: hypothetical protein AAFY03_09055 [Pseudomonadota bacterium]
MTETWSTTLGPSINPLCHAARAAGFGVWSDSEEGQRLLLELAELPQLILKRETPAPAPHLYLVKNG